MKIDEPLKTLGEVQIEPLKKSILALDANVWLLDEQRQRSFDVHRQTQSVVLVFCDTRDGELVVEKREGWRYLADEAVPVMHDLVARHYGPGGTIIRAMAAKLLPGGRINPHFDSHATFRCSHRIHVPITTNDRVRLTVDGRPQCLEVGKAYEIDNQKTHSVINSSDRDRITFIFDYLPATAVRNRVTA